MAMHSKKNGHSSMVHSAELGFATPAYSKLVLQMFLSSISAQEILS
jgi:hypothetical protein